MLSTLHSLTIQEYVPCYDGGNKFSTHPFLLLEREADAATSAVKSLLPAHLRVRLPENSSVFDRVFAPSCGSVTALARYVDGPDLLLSPRRLVRFLELRARVAVGEPFELPKGATCLVLDVAHGFISQNPEEQRQCAEKFLREKCNAIKLMFLDGKVKRDPLRLAEIAKLLPNVSALSLSCRIFAGDPRMICTMMRECARARVVHLFESEPYPSLSKYDAAMELLAVVQGLPSILATVSRRVPDVECMFIDRMPELPLAYLNLDTHVSVRVALGLIAEAINRFENERLDVDVSNVRAQAEAWEAELDRAE